ncbi:hypothetical protein EGW08_011526 [Elysia chlorotica]|uniref:G-protein coupled receptors family 2 profile 2 domain-containing protein n=1 Tax=Elysia chlorotica TaxID=188477 RepID=A0A3S1A224_ELYCH|nr:hypothetical protein EGW08_011526 [Elysia chlorotica]
MLRASTEVVNHTSNEFLAQAAEDWRYLHVKHCGLLCVNGSRVRIYPENFCENPVCFQCDCQPTCVMLGSCCLQGDVRPDGSFVLSEAGSEQALTVPPYVDPELVHCDNLPYTEQGYLQVGRCPPSTTEEESDEVREQCERTIDDDSSLESVISYVDTRSGLLFKNKFCAICNGFFLNTTKAEARSESEFISAENLGRVATPWVITVKCTTYQSLYTITTLKNFLDKAYRRSAPCQLLYEDLPAQMKPKHCYRNKPLDNDDLNCETPIINLCRELRNTSLHLRKFDNMFCALCKGFPLRHKVKENCNRDDGEKNQIVFHIPPLTLLLGVTYRNTAYETKKREGCSSPTEWLDDSGKCRPALCSPGKVIKESRECASAIEQFKGLAYKLFVVFLATKPQKVTIEDIQVLSNKIHASIAEISMESMTDINITVGHDEFHERYATLQRIAVSSYFIGKRSKSRDDYEDDLISLFSGKRFIAGASGRSDDLELISVSVGEELREFELWNNQYVDVFKKLPLPKGHTFTELGTRESKNLLASTFSSSASPAEGVSNYRVRKSMYTQSHETSVENDMLWRLKHLCIDVTYSLTCPYVILNISNISTTVGTFPKLNFLLRGKTVQVSTKQKVAVVDGYMHICTSLYKKLTDRILMQSQESIIERVHFYLEVVCVCVSVTCLLASAFTYCLFPILRSLPGLNTLSLCVSLAVAQICLLVTARWGVNRLLPRGYCLVHAVLLHYSWLASLAWMSACCIHMFRVFTAHGTKFTDTRPDKKRYLRYCVYGFGLPALAVGATCGINAAVTSGESRGYSDVVCFLETHQSIWNLTLALMAPMCLVTLANGVMFVKTIREIVHTTNLQQCRRNRDRQGVLTFVKLSTLTGLLGAVFVAAVQLNSPVVSLLTSPLMALQGVFIFASFTCNRRVHCLYCDLLNRLAARRRKKGNNETNAGVSTVGTSINSADATSRPTVSK